MTSLHHDRRVDDARNTASAAPDETPAPVRGTSRRPAGTVDGTVPPGVPTPRRGKVSRAAAKVARRTKTVEPAESAESAVPATSPARPTPFPRSGPATEPAAGEAVATVVPAFVDEALAPLQSDPADVVPALAAVRRTGGGRHRMPTVRRRPAFYLAAGLVGAVSLGALLDTDPSARADAGAETVSVAEQLGIDVEATATLSPDAESTRLLQELVVSRNQREAATTAAVDAQAAADVHALASAAAAFAAAEEAARPKVVAPVNGARLTSTFGARWGTLHAGIDLAAPMRTPEYAVMDGVVLEAGPASGYGLAVYIQHADGDVTVYGHMDEILVEAGQLVRAGDTIALLGNRGQSTGPHLHFEVHKGGLDGTKVDPLPWLRERGVQI